MSASNLARELQGCAAVIKLACVDPALPQVESSVSMQQDGLLDTQLPNIAVTLQDVCCSWLRMAL